MEPADEKIQRECQVDENQHSVNQDLDQHPEDSLPGNAHKCYFGDGILGRLVNLSAKGMVDPI
jgi:hypothetical protein